MASIRREITIRTSAERLWDALRDVGALHTRLVPGFVTNCTFDGQARTVTFFNGMIVKELIITIDEEARRVVWSAVGGRLTHHNASAKVHAEGSSSCRVEWMADLLPDEVAPAIAGMIEQGLAAMKQRAEQSVA
jgi:Polyketide cyclase / dehydrase and lipid transport